MKYFRPSHPHAIPGQNQFRLKVDWNKAPRGLDVGFIAGGASGYFYEIVTGKGLVQTVATTPGGGVMQPLLIQTLGAITKTTPYGRGLYTMAMESCISAHCLNGMIPNDGSFEVWVMIQGGAVNATGRGFMELTNNNPTSGQNVCDIWYDGGTTTFKVFHYGGATTELDSGVTPVEGRLYHLAFTINGTEGRFYVNGELKASSSAMGSQNTTIFSTYSNLALIALGFDGVYLNHYTDWPILSGFHANVPWTDAEVKARYADPYGFLRQPVDDVFVARAAPVISGDYFGDRYFGPRYFGRYFGGDPVQTAPVLAADGGAYTFSGVAASLEIGREVAMDSGSFSFSGSSADLTINKYAYPSSDISDGLWTNELDSAVDLFQSINESTASDTDYIKSSTNPSNDIAEVELGPMAAPVQPAKVSYRYWKANTGTMNLTVKLMEGSLEIAAWTHLDISTTPVTIEQTLFDDQFAAITDFNALSLQFIANPTELPPVLEVMTTSGVSRPAFNMELSDPAPGDYVWLRRSDSPLMSSPTVYGPVELDYLSASHGVCDFGIADEPDGTSYWQLKHNGSAWSDIETVTISEASVPAGTQINVTSEIETMYIATFGPAAVEFYDVVLEGPEHASRMIHIAMTAVINANITSVRLVTDQDIANGTWDGTLMNLDERGVLGNSRQAAIFSLPMPTGRVFHIYPTGGNFFSLGMATAVSYNTDGAMYDSSVYFDGTDGYGAPADDFTNPALDIPTNGFSFAFFFKDNTSATLTWKNNYTKIADNLTGVPSGGFSVATSVVAGSSTPQVTRGSFIGATLIAASYGP
jgi:hypothetical protein